MNRLLVGVWVLLTSVVYAEQRALLIIKENDRGRSEKAIEVSVTVLNYIKAELRLLNQDQMQGLYYLLGDSSLEFRNFDGIDASTLYTLSLHRIVEGFYFHDDTGELRIGYRISRMMREVLSHLVLRRSLGLHFLSYGDDMDYNRAMVYYIRDDLNMKF